MSFTDLTTEMNIAVDTFKLHLPNQTKDLRAGSSEGVDVVSGISVVSFSLWGTESVG